MEDHEEVYEQEVAADQEVTEPEEPEQEGSGSEESELEETDQEETDQGEGQEETEEEQTGSETGGTEESLEEETGEESAEGSQEEETVSGNDIVIRGDVVVFPEGYEPVMSESESVPADTEAVVKVIESQNYNMTAGFACTCFMLGVLAGAMIIAGFRLRRV